MARPRVHRGGRTGGRGAYVNGLATENDKVLSTLRQEAEEAAGEDNVELVRLFDLDRDADRVDRALNEDLLFVAARNHNGVQEELGALPIKYYC